MLVDTQRSSYMCNLSAAEAIRQETILMVEESQIVSVRIVFEHSKMGGLKEK
jgi:hypothetical protein